jgi:two-component system C4-dicarboxylate transport sensor histidine kinase DctB
MNARDALEHCPQASIWIASWQKNQEVGFQVADNGPGIPTTYRSSLFTPSHSIKVAEKGVGLGLYVCDKAIKELGGKIRYQDRPEGGACFIVALPQLTK